MTRFEKKYWKIGHLKRKRLLRNCFKFLERTKQSFKLKMYSTFNCILLKNRTKIPQEKLGICNVKF